MAMGFPFSLAGLGAGQKKPPSLFERILAGAQNPLVGIGLGAIGDLISTGSERRRLEELRASMTNALGPLEAEARGARFGLSKSEGGIAQAATDSTLGSLASRGVLQSSFAPGEVAQAVAPAELHRQGRLQETETQLAAAKQQIAGATSLPGYGAAFGGALGDVGGFLALRGGVEEGRKRGRRNRVESLLDLIGSGTEEGEFTE